MHSTSTRAMMPLGLYPRVIVSHLPEVFEQKLYADPKSEFQEQAQTRLGMTPSLSRAVRVGSIMTNALPLVHMGRRPGRRGHRELKQEAQRDAAKTP